MNHGQISKIACDPSERFYTLLPLFICVSFSIKINVRSGFGSCMFGILSVLKALPPVSCDAGRKPVPASACMPEL